MLAIETAIGDPTAVQVTGDLSNLDDVDERLQAAELAIGRATAVRRIVHGIDAATAELDNARASNLPQVGVYASYNELGDELSDTDEDWQVGVSVTGAGAGGSQAAEREAVRARIAALGQDMVAERENRGTRLAQAGIDAESLELQILAQRETVDLAEANYDDVRELYRAGRVTLTRVSEASLAVSEAKFALASLLFQQNLVGIELDDLAEKLPAAPEEMPQIDAQAIDPELREEP